MTDWQHQVAENARRYADLRDRVARMSITETTQDGMIRVTVSADGLLTHLELHQRYQGVSMNLLSTRIMACVRRAQARIPDLMRQAMHATGVDDQAGQPILTNTSRKFPAAQAEMTPHVVARRRVPTQQADDADWDNAAVLEDLEGDLR